MAENFRTDFSHEVKRGGNPFSYGSTVKLDGSNYEIWSRVFMMSVIGHEKEHVIEENEPVEKSEKYASWKGDNNIVMSWIMNSVQPQIASTIAYYTSAKQMWDFLKQTYSNDKNVSKILQVEEELLNLQQGDQSLAQYFAYLKSIYERLKALPPPCPTCHKTHGEQSMVAKFLQGLSPEYALAKAQMLTGAKSPDLADAYNRLSRLAVTLSQPSSDLQASALVASGGRGRGSFRGRGIGRGSGGGHLEDRCWDKHGRPSGASLGRNVASKQGKNSLPSPIGSVQATSSVVDGSLSPSHPETVTVSINKSEYEDFLALRSSQPSASTSHATDWTDDVDQTAGVRAEDDHTSADVNHTAGAWEWRTQSAISVIAAFFVGCPRLDSRFIVAVHLTLPCGTLAVSEQGCLELLLTISAGNKQIQS
ncbi:hypothetical protein EJ110_NYTH59672 [Nymphaea thermarum]|nr:hypothetical protein EJ110_NYTH59672 [Nymphaea thermarum]